MARLFALFLIPLPCTGVVADAGSVTLPPSNHTDHKESAGESRALLRNPLRMEILRDENPVELLEGWRMRVLIENVSGKDVQLEKLTWLLPQQLVATRGSRNNDLENSWDTRNFIPPGPLAAGERRVYSLTMPDSSKTTCWLWNATILTWRYNQLPVEVGLEYSSGDLGLPGTLSETVTLKFQTPFRTLVVGAFLGALLAMSFYFFYLKYSVVQAYFKRDNNSGFALEDEITTLQDLWRIIMASNPRHLGMAVMQMITASITAIILLLLLASGNQGMVPLSFTVNDFIGGCFLGLISHKVGKVTFDAIFGPVISVPGQMREATDEHPGLDNGALVLHGTWNEEKKSAELHWSPLPAFMEGETVIKMLAGSDTAPGKGTAIAAFDDSRASSFATARGLENPGDSASYVLVITFPDGTVLYSKPLNVRRPSVPLVKLRETA